MQLPSEQVRASNYLEGSRRNFYLSNPVVPSCVTSVELLEAYEMRRGYCNSIMSMSLRPLGRLV